MKIFTIGAASHARICRRIVRCEPLGAHHDFPVVYDDNSALREPWNGCTLYHDWDEAIGVAKYRGCTHFLVAIGSNGKRRAELSRELMDLGFEPASVIHHSASIGDEVRIGKGLQILANARIGDEVTIGDWCMIHSLGMVEHESVVEDGVTIMAGAAIAGMATLHNYVTVGVNATIKAVTVGEGAVVGDGALVVKDVPPNLTIVGSPQQRTWPRKSA